MSTNGMWSKLSPLLPTEPGRQGSVAKDNRLMVEGMLWKVRTSSPWRDLPAKFGPWESVYTRFSRWCKTGVWREVLKELQQEVDWEWTFLDSTIVRAHQHAHDAKKTLPPGQSIGRSRGGPTTKIRLICDGRGRPLHFRLTGGNIHYVTMAELMLEETPGEAEYTVADKGYDSDGVREKFLELGSDAVIPWKINRKEPGKLKKKMYRFRHRVENAFCSLKQD